MVHGLEPGVVDVFGLYGAFDVHEVGFLFLFRGVGVGFVKFEFDEA